MQIKCQTCGEYREVRVTGEDLVKWDESGQYVQVFFPYLSEDERELLVSGTCGVCFDRMFADPDAECSLHGG